MQSIYDPQIIREKVEVLDGSRSREVRRRAAVRIEDISGLLQISNKLKSAQVSSAPTMHEHNALQSDVADISQRLNEIALALQKRLIG